MKYIRGRGHQVVFAGNESQRQYVQHAFPEITTTHLDGYNVRYSKSSKGFMWALAKQLPGIIKMVKRENNWLDRIIDEYGIDAVISDNRYGLYNDRVPSAVMTHQLQPISGLGDAADKQVRKLHYKFLERFNECWVVDGAANIAGKLSNPAKLPAKTQYLGLLSQLEPVSSNEKGYLLVLLSGPEPQRSILAKRIWEQVVNLDKKVVFIGGSKEGFQPQERLAHVTYHDRLNKEKLQQYLSGADMVICRSGYSTVMDLLKLNKNAILIPTPGQTEQEYLAQQLLDRNMFLSCKQSDLHLINILAKAVVFPFKQDIETVDFNRYSEVVKTWIRGIS